MSSYSVVNALAKIKCPSVKKGRKCTTPNCIFDHSGLVLRDDPKLKEKAKPALQTLIPEQTSHKTNNGVDLSHNTNQNPQVTTQKRKALAAPVAPVDKPKRIRLNTSEDDPKSTTSQTSDLSIANETQEKDIPLAPRPVLPYPPAQTGVRLSFLKLLKAEFVKLKSKCPNKEAVEKEFLIASTTKKTYEVTMKRTIYNMTKSKPLSQKKTSIEDQNDLLYKQLSSLVSTEKVLKQNKYITQVPKLPVDFTVPRKVKCDRCATEFEISKILNPTRCSYHPERFSVSRQTKGSYLSNDINSKFYPCCSKPLGESEGCVTLNSHVFKWDAPEQLHHEIPFQSTSQFTRSPENSKNLRKAIALDCEMGYTTSGFEMIRLTMLDFFSEKVIYDEIIRPKGQVIDLNTYWSGVSSITAENSVSFDEMIQDLNKLIDKDTILIGHSLENDLNVMRILHQKVVDTSILFPRGMRKRSLKDITFEFLSKTIQTGEHDSEEDARSCIDILKWHIKRKTQSSS